MDQKKLFIDIIGWFVIIGLGYFITRYRIIPKLKENVNTRNRNGKE